MEDYKTFTLDVAVGQANFSASGESDDVLRAFEDFQELIKRPVELQFPEDNKGTTEVGRDEERPTTVSEVEQANALTEEKVPLRVFLDSKKLPRGNAIIGLGITIWAKRYENVQEIDVDIVKTYWRDSGRKIPANISRDLGTAATEGWLERLPTKGQFSATSYGEKHFDELESASK